MTDTTFQSDFLKTLQARGYIQQITHPAELDAAAKAGAVVTSREHSIDRCPSTEFHFDIL